MHGQQDDVAKDGTQTHTHTHTQAAHPSKNSGCQMLLFVVPHTHCIWGGGDGPLLFSSFFHMTMCHGNNTKYRMHQRHTVTPSEPKHTHKHTHVGREKGEKGDTYRREAGGSFAFYRTAHPKFHTAFLCVCVFRAALAPSL